MRQRIEEYRNGDLAGIQALIRELTAGLIRGCTDAEPEEGLGCSRYDNKNKCEGSV